MKGGLQNLSVQELVLPLRRNSFRKMVRLFLLWLVVPFWNSLNRVLSVLFWTSLSVSRQNRKFANKLPCSIALQMRFSFETWATKSDFGIKGLNVCTDGKQKKRLARMPISSYIGKHLNSKITRKVWL